MTDIFNPKESEKEFIIPDVHFEKIIVDADTAVYQAANNIQEDYIEVIHKPSGTKKEFKNKTEFHGHWKKKAGGWLAQKNSDRIEKGLEPFDVEDFEIVECARLSSEIDDHIKEAVNSFDYFVGTIKKAVSADDYLLCIGGEGNFRYDIAKILPYKGNRKEKPIYFQEVRDAILDKYKSKIEIVNGEEVDDRLGQYGWENYLNHRKTGEWKYCLSYIDKDLKMIISPSFNFRKISEGLQYTTPEDSATYFCMQLLIGDKTTDNIPGLPNFTKEVQEKYGIRGSRGIGEALATKYLADCESVKEMFERVVEAYKSYYGDVYEFTSYNGKVYIYSWLDFLRENAILLYMRREKDEMYDIKDTLDRLGVNCK